MTGMTRTPFGERYGHSLRLDDQQMHRYAERARAARSAVYAEMFKGIGRGLRASVRTVAAAIERRRRRLATQRELSALDDCLLRDIGVRRYDIPALADASATTGRRRRDRRSGGVKATVSALNVTPRTRYPRWRHTA